MYRDRPYTTSQAGVLTVSGDDSIAMEIRMLIAALYLSGVVDYPERMHTQSVLFYIHVDESHTHTHTHTRFDEA